MFDLKERVQNLSEEQLRRVAGLLGVDRGPDEVSDDRRLVAYVVPEDAAAPPDGGELREFLQGRLPEHMVPFTIVVTDELPRGPNGKIDRRELSRRDLTAEVPQQEFVEPSGELEQCLAGIWSDVLGIEEVSSRDNFFELGGHSLLATQVISRVREAFQVEISVRSLFDAPTIHGLAVVIETELIAELEALPEDEAEGLVND